ncbi:hypothetical protein K504DRAFT_487298 [Pleomassaria siparia CBS 279.74]|uniref:Uncharacterized protein n=1 Tax=Pleomassaria siparia CBS 279.74 TaxID=1314801 RepID=A0A6G1KS40_9PLEO|nr:hypothetical protein K504DRAFT_487298 [Pleomassaria siparia CBS 279.74]
MWIVMRFHWQLESLKSAIGKPEPRLCRNLLWKMQVFLTRPQSRNTNGTSKWYSGMNTAAASSFKSANAAFSDFVATATQFNIDPAVTSTNTEGVVDFNTLVPDWFEALPSDVRNAQEVQNEMRVSVANRVISLMNELVTSTPAGPLPTATGSARSGALSSTGAASGASGASSPTPTPTPSPSPSPSPSNAASKGTAGMGAIAIAVAGAAFL